MDMLALILGLSAIMWYIIDRFKGIWSEIKIGKYITIAVSAIFGFGLSFGFGLDLIYALKLTEATSIIGVILTGFSLMSGSSAIAEILERIKGKKTEE